MNESMQRTGRDLGPGYLNQKAWDPENDRLPCGCLLTHDLPDCDHPCHDSRRLAERGGPA